ncbi:MAG: phospholipase D family protein [Bacteroidetes bacterium]|nr:phospholipase D family protein [Bacteroidota bacterium]
MAKFLKGNELNTEVGKIFENAEQKLILISPYIKLHHRYADELKSKVKNDDLEIIIVFGKNEQDITKSLTAADLDFFKQFPKIEIRYEKRLHAKFYANESSQIITSMNLYDFSQDENIEVGVKTEYSLLSNFTSTVIIGEKNLDQDAWDYFGKVIENSELLFKNVPEYEG